MLNRLKDNRRPFDVNEIKDDVEEAMALAGEQARLPLLEEREHMHGSYESNAIICQQLRTVFRSVPGWARISEVERQSLDEIALKVARALSGKPMCKEHWEDIVGYAELIRERCA